MPLFLPYQFESKPSSIQSRFVFVAQISASSQHVNNTNQTLPGLSATYLQCFRAG